LVFLLPFEPGSPQIIVYFQILPTPIVVVGWACVRNKVILFKEEWENGVNLKVWSSAWPSCPEADNIGVERVQHIGIVVATNFFE